MTRTTSFILSVTASVSLVAATPTGPAYYVATTGNDSYSCNQAQSPSTPKRTINGGIACMRGGETLIISGGTYSESIVAIPSGTAGAWTTIRGASGEQAIIKPSSGQDVVSIYDRSYIVLDNLVMDGSNVSAVGLRIGGNGPAYAHFIAVQNSVVRNAPSNSCITQQGPGGANSNLSFINLDVYNCGVPGSTAGNGLGHGIYLLARDSLIEHSRIHDISGHGIHLYVGAGSEGTVSNNIIRYNQVYSNGSWGILLGGGANNVAHTNLVWDNAKIITGAGGIRIAYGSNSYNKAYNNTIYRNWGPCTVNEDGVSSEIKNNICWQNTQNAVYDQGTNSSVSNNLLQDPKFANTSNFDFRLLAGSPAINAGVNVGISQDFAGTLLPTQGPIDIGAFEYVP